MQPVTQLTLVDNQLVSAPALHTGSQLLQFQDKRRLHLFTADGSRTLIWSSEPINGTSGNGSELLLDDSWTQLLYSVQDASGKEEATGRIKVEVPLHLHELQLPLGREEIVAICPMTLIETNEMRRFLLLAYRTGLVQRFDPETGELEPLYDISQYIYVPSQKDNALSLVRSKGKNWGLIDFGVSTDDRWFALYCTVVETLDAATPTPGPARNKPPAPTVVKSYYKRLCEILPSGEVHLVVEWPVSAEIVLSVTETSDRLLVGEPYLYVASAANDITAANLATLEGKVLRFNIENPGAAVAQKSNPFAQAAEVAAASLASPGVAGEVPVGARPEIYAYQNAALYGWTPLTVAPQVIILTALVRGGPSNFVLQEVVKAGWARPTSGRNKTLLNLRPSGKAHGNAGPIQPGINPAVGKQLLPLRTQKPISKILDNSVPTAIVALDQLIFVASDNGELRCYQHVTENEAIVNSVEGARAIKVSYDKQFDLLWSAKLGLQLTLMVQDDQGQIYLLGRNLAEGKNQLLYFAHNE